VEVQIFSLTTPKGVREMTRKDHPAIRKVCPPSGPGKRADYGIYFGDNLVGLITYCNSSWKLWKVKRGSRIDDPCAIKHYTDHLDLIMRFNLLKDARFFAKRAFTSEYLHRLDSAVRPAMERRSCPKQGKEDSTSSEQPFEREPVFLSL
jgi:hypothetical protein